jgi:hypothetical protein
MLKQTSRSRSALVLIVGLSLMCSSALAQGDRNRTDRGSSSRGDIRGDMRADVQQDKHNDNSYIHRNDKQGHRYHYREGRWYKRGWFGWEFAVAALAVGVMVEALPPRHTTIIVEDTPYYYDDTVYYRQLPDGAYIVVAPPRGR